MQYYCSLYSKFYFSSGLCYIDALARDAYKCTRKKSLSKERKRKIATKHCWMQETTTWPKEIEIKPNIKFRNKKGTNLDSGVWSSRADDVEEEIPDCTPALKPFSVPSHSDSNLLYFDLETTGLCLNHHLFQHWK